MCDAYNIILRGLLIPTAQPEFIKIIGQRARLEAHELIITRGRFVPM